MPGPEQGTEKTVVVAGMAGSVVRELSTLLLNVGQRVAAVAGEATDLPSATACLLGEGNARQITLATALRHSRALFVNPATTGQATSRLLALAIHCGVRRVVLLSSSTASRIGRQRSAARHFDEVERAVVRSGLPWTLLRAGAVAATALTWAPQIRTSDVVRGAYGDAMTAPIHQRDIAAVALRALLGPQHAGHTYELRGGHSLSQREMVRIIGNVVGRDLRFEEIDPELAEGELVARGLSAGAASAMLAEQAELALIPEPPSTVVAELLGRPALTFTDWAAEHAPAFDRPDRP